MKNKKSSDDLKQGLWIFPIPEKSPKIGWRRYYNDGVLYGLSIWGLVDQNIYTHYVEGRKDGEEVMVDF